MKIEKHNHYRKQLEISHQKLKHVERLGDREHVSRNKERYALLEEKTKELGYKVGVASGRVPAPDPQVRRMSPSEPQFPRQRGGGPQTHSLAAAPAALEGTGGGARAWPGLRACARSRRAGLEPETLALKVGGRSVVCTSSAAEGAAPCVQSARRLLRPEGLPCAGGGTTLGPRRSGDPLKTGAGSPRPAAALCSVRAKLPPSGATG